MRYRNISLNNTEGQFSLLKYDSDYNWFEKVREFNTKLALAVQKYPFKYDENSKKQAYMIVYNDSFVAGLINIDSSNEKKLDIEVELSESVFDCVYYQNIYSNEMLYTFNALIDSLKLYFYDKENIEIYLHNDIDLSKIDPLKYTKKTDEEKNIIRYITKNDNCKKIPKLINEISSVSDSKVNIKKKESKDLDLFVDEYLAYEIEEDRIPLNELFNKVKTVELFNRLDLNKTRKMKVSRNGYVEVVDEVNYMGYPKVEYVIKYNVPNKGFSLAAYDIDNDIDFYLTDSKYMTTLNTKNIKFVKNKYQNNKESKLTYKDKTILLEAYAKNDKIEKINIDLYSRKKCNGKINGTFALRVNPKYGEFYLRHYTRKGLANNSFSFVMKNVNTELFKDIENGNITVENIGHLINCMFIASNMWTDRINNINKVKRNSIILENIVPNFSEECKKVFDVIEKINEETPLPHLKENLSIFLNEYPKKEKNNNKILQKKI